LSNRDKRSESAAIRIALGLEQSDSPICRSTGSVGGISAYKKKCDEIAASGYEGFRLGAFVEEQRFAAD
jgi:hypothetical protein